MAVVNSPPIPPISERSDSFGDEKGIFEEKGSDGSVEVAGSIQGDVYDDIRAIDMGEDGKERPIGTVVAYLLKIFTYSCLTRRDRHRRRYTLNISRR